VLILITRVGGLGYTIELEANLQTLYHVYNFQPTYQCMTLLLYVQCLRHVLYDEVHKYYPQKAIFIKWVVIICMAFDAFIYTHL
jgi:hypothetical protein